MIHLCEVKVSTLLEIRILVTSGSNADWAKVERSLLGFGNTLYPENDESYTDVYINRNIHTLHLKLVHCTHFAGQVSINTKNAKKGKLKYHLSPIKLAKVSTFDNTLCWWGYGGMVDHTLLVLLWKRIWQCPAKSHVHLFLYLAVNNSRKNHCPKITKCFMYKYIYWGHFS